MADRRFTIEDADKLLPLLILEFGRLAVLREQAAVLARQLGGMEQALAGLQTGEAPHGLEAQAGQFALCTAEFQRGIERINAIGCLVKDVEGGMVDFPSQLDGELVHLCWQLGEPAVRHFHKVDEDDSKRVLLPGATNEPVRLH